MHVSAMHVNENKAFALACTTILGVLKLGGAAVKGHHHSKVTCYLLQVLRDHCLTT